MSWKFTNLRLQPHFPGVDELNQEVGTPLFRTDAIPSPISIHGTVTNVTIVWEF